MKYKLLALAVAAITIGSALVAQTQAQTTRIVLFPLSTVELNNAISEGLQVIESYDNMVVADADSSLLSWLNGNAAVYHELIQETGRGSYFGDPTLGELVPSDRRSEESSLRIVEFRGPVRTTWRDGVTNAGATIISPLHFNAMLVHAVGAARSALPSLDGVRWTGAYHPGFRLAPELWMAANGTSVIVAAHQLVTPSALSLSITTAGCISTATWTFNGVPYAKCSGGSINFATLAFDDNIQWIERAPDSPVVAMSSARGIVQGGRPVTSEFYNHSIFGQNQLVAVADTGVYTSGEFSNAPRTVVHETLSDSSTNIPGFPDNSCGLSHRKIAAYVNPQEGNLFLSDERDDKNTDNGFHGTKMAAIIAGDRSPQIGTPDTSDGVAPSARLVVLDIGPNSGSTIITPNAYRVILDPGYNCGARIQSNSWGKDIEAPFFYTHFGQQIDKWLLDRPDYLALWAMGNSADDLMFREATAKNVLSVGAAANPGANDVWSSPEGRSARGPTAEGRIKPDLLAASAPITTASCSEFPDACGPQDYANTPGMTSAATAIASGAMALLRQYFTDGWYPTGTRQTVDQSSPSAAALRAVALAGTRPMTGLETYDAVPQWPNGRQGWGRLEIDSSAFFQDEATRLLALQVSPLGVGQAYSRSFSVTSSSEPLNIAVTWPDCPGVPDAWPQNQRVRPSLCSDLQLIVVDPQGRRYIGNNFAVQQDGQPASAEGGLPDITNVIEMVRVASPPIGQWSIHVVLEYSTQSTQGFAFASRGAIADSSLNLAPFTPNRPVGPTLAVVFEIATYTVTSQGDRDEDRPIRIEISWGDGSQNYISQPVEPTPNGIVVTTTHQWTQTGAFAVRARAIDERGALSPWSSTLPVTIVPVVVG